MKYTTFEQWWELHGQKKVLKMEENYIANNEPNGEDDEDEGDEWYVNKMFHEGEAEGETFEKAEEAFEKGKNGSEWIASMENSLFCELDEVIADAYKAGKKIK